MTTKRHRARRIALQLLYNSDVLKDRSAEHLTEQAVYYTFEDIMVESIASELSEEEVEQKVKEILNDQERRDRRGWKARPRDPEIDELCEFALELARGVLDCQDLIDQRLVEVSEHWRLDRMSVVDRNILRLGTFELLFRADIPPKVSIDEAVELAKEYGDEKSGAFVNGILDVLAEKRLAQPPEQESEPS